VAQIAPYLEIDSSLTRDIKERSNSLFSRYGFNSHEVDDILSLLLAIGSDRKIGGGSILSLSPFFCRRFFSQDLKIRQDFTLAIVLMTTNRSR
jgi:hypothetical protein